MLFLVHHLSSLVPISVNLIQIIFIWHMPTLWQRWVIAEGFGHELRYFHKYTLKCSYFKHTLKCSYFFLFLSIYSELPYWWGRRRRRGNGGKCWGWDALWGATVRTGNGRPGARDQEHSGAVALDASSDIIIGTLLHDHISFFLSLFCLITSVGSVCALSLLFVCCASFIVSCLIWKLKAPIQIFFLTVSITV